MISSKRGVKFDISKRPVCVCTLSARSAMLCARTSVGQAYLLRQKGAGAFSWAVLWGNFPIVVASAMTFYGLILKPATKL
jgi:hypothetical protein